MKMTYDQLIESKHDRRLRSDDRLLARTEKLEAKAQRHIGELASGRFYISLPGVAYRESDSQQALIDFLIRNKYV